jgi:hypothetical protein
MEKDGLKAAAILYGVEMLQPGNSLYILYVNDSQIKTVLVLRTIRTIHLYLVRVCCFSLAVP